jgi:putative hemolysin
MKSVFSTLSDSSIDFTRQADRGVDSRYTVKLAERSDEIAEAQALRSSVFNFEMTLGRAQGLLTRLDRDIFDEACDHLLVRDVLTGHVVGTYRMQTGRAARSFHDYNTAREFDLTPFNTAREFDLSPFEPYREETVEIGRACVHAHYRTSRVLLALWGGIAAYLLAHRARYVLGCSSLFSQDESAGMALYRKLAAQHPAPDHLSTQPWSASACRGSGENVPCPRVPGLLAAYLSLGGWIAAPPAVDRESGIIDYLTLLDMRALDPAAARVYLGPVWSSLLMDFFSES